MQFSIVSTLYYSAPYLDEFLQRILASVEQITDDYELILVNDGSPDNSLLKALQAKQQNPRIKIIDLSRNFGHHPAGMVGLAQAQGDYVFLIDCDLEEPPELLQDFWQVMQHEMLDVVYGVQAKRKGKSVERYSGQLFYTLFNALSEIPITPNALTIRLMKQQFVAHIIQYPERNLFMAGIMAHAGFKQKAIIINKASKPATTYTFAKRFKLFITSITAFSTKPLEYLLFSGIITLLLALLSLLLISLKALLTDTLTITTVILWASFMLTGSIMTCTGLLGLYIANIQTEIKQRPRAIIKHIY